MANPFEKRATEYLRDDEAFLAVVTPDPLVTFFKKPAEEERLYDRLAIIIGTPGSGKTTIARLFQYSTLVTLLRNRDRSTYRSLVDTLVQCKVIANEQPTILGCRLPLETDYREFWEFPYSDELKTNLMIALLQARAVLSWLRNLETAGHSLDEISIVPGPDAEAATASIGGVNARAVLERAQKIELSIYKVSAALIAPQVNEIEADAVTAYRPLDVIDSFRIRNEQGQLDLRPLMILDDAHGLHPEQLSAVRRWLTRREIRAARWILMRLDALNPTTVLTDKKSRSPLVGKDSGLFSAREITPIWLQGRNNRRAFRKMAKDMSSRYIKQMDVFSRRGLDSLSDLLATEPELLRASHRKDLSLSLKKKRAKYSFTDKQWGELEKEVERYTRNAKDQDVGEDVQLEILSILVERYSKRVPQASLFEEMEDLEPSRPLVANSSIADGARVHLMHKYNRPYYFGIETLCDASSENAEQFLQLAARLVARSETQLIRAKSPTLLSGTQHRLLRERAEEMLNSWDFPNHDLVRHLSDKLASLCLEKSLEANASLGGGATAIGILQDEFDTIPLKYPKLAQVLQFGVAYNVFTLVPQYGTKKKSWCLIELGGVLLLYYGLSLKRGGFLERRVEDLDKMLSEP